jgi:hypothetical protein
MMPRQSFSTTWFDRMGCARALDATKRAIDDMTHLVFSVAVSGRLAV